MLVLDEANFQRHTAIARQQAAIEKTRKAAEEAIRKEKAAVANDGERTTTLLEAQLGRPMSSDEVVKRLKALTYKLKFEVAKADPKRMGVYFHDGVTNLDNKDPNYRGWRHICGMERGFMPEFSVRHADEQGKFKSETRGWRTLVATLVREKIITLAAAERAFDIAQGRDSKNWQDFTGGR